MSEIKRIFKIVLNRDYNTSVKIGDREVRCFSSKQMKRMYPEKDYELMGEVVKSDKHKLWAYLSTSEDPGENLRVYRTESYSRILYRKAGYVAVEGNDDSYILLLKSRIPFLIIMSAIIVAAIIALAFIIASVLHGGDEPDTPEYLVPEVESNAQVFAEDPDNTEKAQSEKGGGSVSMIYSEYVQVNLASNTLYLAFANPSRSNQDCIISLYVTRGDAEYLIGKTGLIEPGYEISAISLLTDSVVLSEGTYDGYMAVDYYDTSSAEMALVASHIPVSIAVS